MKNVKAIFSNISLEFKNLLKKFPVTFITIVFTAICNIILIEGVHNVNKIFTLGILLICGCFFSESSFKNKTYKVISILINVVLSILLTFKIEIIVAYRYISGYILILATIAIYKIIKENKIDFNKYLLKTFSNIFHNVIIYLVLAIGVGLITVIFAELILETYTSTIILDIQVALFWVFFVTSIINGITNIKGKESTTFINKLVEYVLFPLIAIAVVIIYIYILKIIIFWQIPSNMIFRILAIMFIFAFPIWNMTEALENKNKILERTVKIIPYLYIPFILLEIYSLGIRIFEFGITPIRYLGLAFLILQIIALILTYTNKKKISITLICMAVLSLIVFVSPINLEKASELSQMSILKNAMKKETNFNYLSEEEKEKVRGSYEYLSIESPGSIPEYIKEQKENISNYTSYNDTIREKSKHIYYYNDIDEIDISGYNKAIQIYSNSTGSNLYKFILTSENSNETVGTIDLEKTINDFIIQNNNNLNVNDYITSNNKIKADETSALYITRLTVKYNSNNEVEYISLYGLLLKK